MTKLINLELTEMKANELREIAKEYKMPGSWKAKKNEMIDFLEIKKSEQIEEAEELVEFVNEVIEVEIEKTDKPIKQNKQIREIILFDNEDNFFAEFKTQSEAIKYCEKEKLANSVWIRRSVKTGEKFYLPNGKKSVSQKNKYNGVGYYAMKKAELIKQEA